MGTRSRCSVVPLHLPLRDSFGRAVPEDRQDQYDRLSLIPGIKGTRTRRVLWLSAGAVSAPPMWRVRLAAKDASLSRRRSRVQIPHTLPHSNGAIVMRKFYSNGQEITLMREVGQQVGNFIACLTLRFEIRCIKLRHFLCDFRLQRQKRHLAHLGIHPSWYEDQD